MPLPTQVADFNLAEGLQQTQDPKQQSPNAPAVADNCIIGKNGRLDKRYGFSALANAEITGGAQLGSTNAGDPRKFIKHDDALWLAASGGRVHAVVGGETLSGDHVPMWDVSRQGMARRAGETIAMADVCTYTSAYELYAYTTGDISNPRIRARLYESTSRVVVMDVEMSASNRINPKCVTIGTKMVVFYCDTSGNLYQRTLDTGATDLSFAAEATVLTDLSTTASNQAYDVCLGPTSTEYFVAYRDSTPDLRVRRVTLPATTTVNATVASTSPSKGVAIYFNTTLWIGWHDTTSGTDTYGAVLNATTLATTAGPTLLSSAAATQRIGVVGDGTECCFVWDHEVVGSDPHYYTNWRTMDSTGSLGSGAGKLLRTHVQSKPIITPSASGSKYHVVLGFARTIPGTVVIGALYLVDISSTDDARVMAHFADLYAQDRYEVFGGKGRAYSNLGSIAIKTNVLLTSPPEFDEYIFPALINLDDATKTSAPTVGLDRASLTLSTHWHHAQLGPTTAIASGLLSQFDGSLVLENNFAYYPWIIGDNGGADSGFSSAGLANGDYNYVVLYEARDDKGQVYWSRVSEPYTFTADNSSWPANLTYVTLTIPYLHPTNRQDTENGYVPNVTIRVFRTVVGGVEPYYEVFNNSTGTVVEVNDPTATTGLSFVDISTDLEITSNGRPYTDGGVENNEPPPPCKFVEAHKGRLWIAGCEDSRELRFTKELTQGEAPAFPAANVVRFDTGLELSGIASMDDALIVFTPHEIYRIYGSGPNDQGEQSDLTEPSIITTDVGCVDGYHILKTRHGLIFRGGQSIYLLDRGFQVHNIGAAVGDELRAAPVITGAVVRSGVDWLQSGIEPSITLAMFSIVGGSGFRVLVYDIERRAWLRWMLRIDNETINEVQIQDMAMLRIRDAYGQELHYVIDNWTDNVLLETVGAFADPGAVYVERDIQTPWYTPAGPQGLFRARWVSILGEKIGSHKLTVSVGFDYSNTWTVVGTWTHAQLSALSLSPTEMVRIRLPTKPCVAVRFRIQEQEDATDNTQTEGMHLTGIRLGFAVKRRSGPALETNASRA